MEIQETLSQEELQNNNKENNTDATNVNTNNNINSTGGSLLPDNPDDKTCYWFGFIAYYLIIYYLICQILFFKQL